MPFPRRRKNLFLAAALMALALGGIAWAILAPPGPRRLADRIQVDVAEIRGLQFKHPVPIKVVSREEWREYILGEMRRVPEVQHFWPVMRMLGIYKGPDLGPRENVVADMLGSPGAAYDARVGAFLLGTEFEGDHRKVVFAHELQHGMQDQHFDMQRYMLDFIQSPDASSDEVLARASVIEGEAAFVDAQFQAKHAPTTLTTRDRMAAAIGDEGLWDPAHWEKKLESPELDEQARARLRGMIDASTRIPPFMIELTLCRYIDGMAFVRELQERGWSEVAKLYGEYPPVSTEQILHPEKWFAREEPARIGWPPFDADPLFADWQLLLQDNLGERHWHVVFRAQGLSSLGPAAAAGWNGDRYAVFRNKNSDAMLMLMYTSWDTPEDANEFADAYGRLLQAKYSAGTYSALVQTVGNTVRIVEGAPEQSIDAFMAFNARAEASAAR
jgi:hypothetical protein